MTVYCVKIREVGKKRWGFLTPRGGINYLRIHASQFYEQAKADACVKDINENNVGKFEAKAEIFAAEPVSAEQVAS